MPDMIKPEDAAEAINRRFGAGTAAADDMRLLVGADSLLDVCRWLKEESPWRLEYLNSLTAVDYKTHFSVVYHLSSLETGERLTFKADLDDRQSPSLPSLTPVWAGADLQEREVFDMFGITFTGHPNLKRLFLWEGFPGYPLRKDWVARDA